MLQLLSPDQLPWKHSLFLGVRQLKNNSKILETLEYMDNYRIFHLTRCYCYISSCTFHISSINQLILISDNVKQPIQNLLIIKILSVALVWFNSRKKKIIFTFIGVIRAVIPDHAMTDVSCVARDSEYVMIIMFCLTQLHKLRVQGHWNIGPLEWLLKLNGNYRSHIKSRQVFILRFIILRALEPVPGLQFYLCWSNLLRVLCVSATKVRSSLLLWDDCNHFEMLRILHTKHLW